MMVMSIPYELNGRVAQKRRTRDAVIAAAHELVASGIMPTVEAAAEAASISRTTAYRYFPSQRALLVAAHPETGATSLLPEDAPDDVATRLDLVIDAFLESNLENEAQQRTMLRLSLEASPIERAQLPLRQGRAIKWIEEALAPLQATMPEAERTVPMTEVRNTKLLHTGAIANTHHVRGRDVSTRMCGALGILCFAAWADSDLRAGPAAARVSRSSGRR